MNESKPGPTILKFGLTAGLINSLIFLISTITGMADPAKSSSSYIIGILSFVVLITVLVMAIRKQRDELQDGFISLGQCILLGVGVVLFSALITSLISVFYTKIIDPGYMDRIMAGMEEAWEAQGLSEEQMEQAKTWTNFMKNPLLSIAFNLLCFGIGGLILSLILGLIMKKEKPEFS